MTVLQQRRDDTLRSVQERFTAPPVDEPGTLAHGEGGPPGEPLPLQYLRDKELEAAIKERTAALDCHAKGSIAAAMIAVTLARLENEKGRRALAAMPR